MVSAVDLCAVRELAGNDAPGLWGYLQQLLGEPFLFFRPSYADELTLHLGTPREAASPKLKQRVRGSYVLTLRGSIWTLVSVEEKFLAFSGPPAEVSPAHMKPLELRELEKSSPVKPGSQVVWATPYVDECGGYGLSLGFSDQSRLLIRPSPADSDAGDDLPEIADWELFTPHQRFLRVGPGAQWAYLPSTDEKKPLPTAP
jgi:hypothetical protein